MDQAHNGNAISATTADHNDRAEASSSLLAIAEEPRQRSYLQRNGRPTSLEDWWVWELAGLALSAVALLCIVVLLWKYNGKQQPEWEHFSLNTVVAWLSTIAKASVLVAATREIGQLKWIWFVDTERSLADIQIYDAASRGIAGCLLLLLKFKARYLATFASVTVILAVGFDPFLQNMIRYYSETVVSTTKGAYLGIATSYNVIGPKIDTDMYYVDSAMKANLYNSLVNADISQQWAIPMFTCLTGNCTWGPTATLAIRSLCTDLTSMLETSCMLGTNATSSGVEICAVSLNGSKLLKFTNDPSLARTSLNLTAAGWGTYLPPMVFRNETFPLIRYVSAIGNEIGIPGTKPNEVTKDTKFVATECSLEPYVVKIQAEVKGNTYSEKILGEWSVSNTTSSPELMPENGNSLTFSPPWILEKDGQQGMNITLGWEAWKSLADCIRFMLNGSFSSWQPSGDGTGGGDTGSAGGTSIITNTGINFYPAQDVVLALATNNFTSYTDNPQDKLSGAMSNVAKALTKSIRDASYIAHGAVASEDIQMAVGETIVGATFVRIQWSWLALPVTVWILTLVTFIGTAWQTNRLGIMSWGNSTVPLLFLRNHDWELDAQDGISCGDYQRQAEKIRVHLRITRQTAALSDSQMP